MIEEFGWYVLAGFTLGLAVSTLWEWIYFRRRRMTIRDRRIAELEATVRTYAAAAGPQGSAAATDDWGEPGFQNPRVYLETEEIPSASSPPDTVPPSESDLPGQLPAFVALSATAASSAKGRTGGSPAPEVFPTNSSSGSSLSVVSFQSLAVQPSPVAVEPLSPAMMAQRDSSPSPLAESLALLGVATAVKHATEESSLPAVDADDAMPTPVSPADKSVAVFNPQTTEQAYINGRTDSAYSDATNGILAPSTTPSHPVGASVDLPRNSDGSRPITSTDINVLVNSINDLIETVNHEESGRTARSVAPTDAGADNETRHSAYTTQITGSTEYVLVRLVQSVVEFFRQMRAILTGADAQRPVLRIADGITTGDDLTRIAGLSRAQADRLRIAGVTTYARLAQLTPDELRLITLTPDGVVVDDPAQWRVAAAQLDAAQGADR